MRALKIILLAVMLCLVPLRALAAVTGQVCPEHHDRMAMTQTLVHEHGGEDHAASSHDDGGMPSTCSLCTACCSGASFVAETRAAVEPGGPALELIPFRKRHPASSHPGTPDRPPLSR